MPVVDDLGLLDMRAEIDFTYDERGRMLRTNDPVVSARRPAPRFTIGCATGGYVVRYGASLDDERTRQLQAIVAALPRPGTPQFRNDDLDRFRACFGDSETFGGPAYGFPDVIAATEQAVRLTEANRDLVREALPWLYDEFADWYPCFVVVADEKAVSACYSSRIGDRASEAGVDTLPGYRGRGYAAIATAAWGAAVRASGRIPIYSTGWSNLASQGVARKLSLRQFGSDATWE